MLLIVLALLADLAWADCFFYPDSPLFCQDLPLEEAQRECSFFEDCSPERAIAPQGCASFPVCEKVWCKGTCQQEPKGQCTTGEFLPEEKEQWCTPGCCRIQDACEYKPSRWRCEMEAKMKSLDYQFQTELDEQQCQESCPRTVVVPLEQLQVPPPEIKVKDFTAQGLPVQEGSSFPAWLAAILIIAVMVYLYFQRKKIFSYVQKAFFLPPAEKPKPKLDSSLPWYFFPKEMSERMKRLKFRYQKRAQRKHREEFLVEKGLAPVKSAPSHLEKLQRIVHHHEQPWKPKVDYFRSLEQRLPRKEEKKKEPETELVLGKLRKLARKGNGKV